MYRLCRVWAHGGQGRTRSFSIILCHYLETEHFTGPELSESVSTPQCCVTGMNRYTCLFTWMLGIQTRVLMTAEQTLLTLELTPQPHQHQLQTQTFNWSPLPFWPQSPVCSHITHPGNWSYNSFYTGPQSVGLTLPLPIEWRSPRHIVPLSETRCRSSWLVSPLSHPAFSARPSLA